MEFIVEEGKSVHQGCSTLVLPALSIGNVGQLAMDLLISTTRAERVGAFDSGLVLPCVGNDAFGPLPLGELALPLEAYESISNSLTLVQQRSPVVKGMMIEFARSMADYAAASGMKHVVLLSSLDFGRWQRIDSSSGAQVHYLSSVNNDGHDEYYDSLGWKRLQEFIPDQRTWKYLNDLADGTAVLENESPFGDDGEDEEDYYPSLPFAALYTFFKAKGLKVTCLFCYCSEGDNMSDAMNLADATCKLLGTSLHNDGGTNSRIWLIPFSWNSVYGPPPDTSMF